MDSATPEKHASIPASAPSTAQEQQAPAAANNAAAVEGAAPEPETAAEAEAGAAAEATADAASASASASSQQGQMVSSGLHSLWDSSLSLYSTLRDKAYDRSRYLNYGIDKLEEIAKKSQPYAQKLYTSSVEPVVNTLDTKVESLASSAAATTAAAKTAVDSAVATATAKTAAAKTAVDSAVAVATTAAANAATATAAATATTAAAVLPEAWIATVDSVLLPRFDPRQSFDFFVSTATVAYIQLTDAAAATAAATAATAARARAATTSAATTAATATASAASAAAAATEVKYDDFLAVVKTQLAKVWDARLTTAAQATFTAIQVRALSRRYITAILIVFPLY